MTISKDLKILEQAIAAIWRQGLTLSPDALHYIDSTLAGPTVQELSEILGDESHCERDPLLELIFFPDRSLQAQLEDLLERYDYTADDVNILSRSLSGRKPETTLMFPDGRGRLSLDIPDWAVERFISRLNIHKKLAPALIDAVRRHVPAPDQNGFKVRLRNTRFEFSEDKIYFLTVLLEKLAVDFRIVESAFDFMLSFFEEPVDDANLYGALMQKKRFYFQNLQKARRFEARLKSSNMETLILQGVRMSYFNPDEARRRIGLIDRICFAVFGKSELLPDGAGFDLGEVDRDSDMEAVFKFLS